MPRRLRHRWLALEVDGELFHVKGDPDMDPRTREALIALARAVRAMYEQGTLPTAPEETMQIKTITVRYGRTQSLESYSNVRPEITLSAELAEGEAPDAAKEQLLAEARAFVEEAIDQAIEQDGRAAKFSREPRYRLITTRTLWAGAWNRERKQEPAERLAIIVPHGTKLERPRRDDGVSACWWEEQAGKMRFGHAWRVAAEYLAEHEEYRLIDASDGDLSKVPAWVFEAVVVEPKPAPVTVGDDEGDEGDDDDA